VNYTEPFFASLLVVTLLGVSSYFTLKQFRVRCELARDRSIPSADRKFLLGQSRRRLICSMLMFLFAGFLIGWYLIESNVSEWTHAAEREPGQTPPFVQFVAYYWITALLVLFGIIALAGIDFFATARYGMHQKKLLEIEQRTLLEIEAARLREQRKNS